MKHDRCKKLFGKNFETLQKAKIIILGVGGVGSFALDCLYKSGIENITIVDYDRYDVTNQNRQIGSEAVGELKVNRLKELYPNIIPIEAKIDVGWVNNFDMSQYDIILDAIDDIRPKVELIKKYHKKLISTSGSAKRYDSTKIEYIDIFKTYNDPFVKKIRDQLKKDKFDKKFKVIFSSEPVQCEQLGSFVGVTGAFGLAMCSKAIEKLKNIMIN